MPHKRDRIQVDPLDLEDKTVEERTQLALEAVRINGFCSNGRPWLSLHEAAEKYGITKGRLTGRFNGKKTKQDAHVNEMNLTFAQEDALAE